MESILCPAKETLRSHGLDTVTWVRQAAFLVVRVPPEGSEPHMGAECLGDEVQSACLERLLLWEPSGTLGVGGEF